VGERRAVVVKLYHERNMTQQQTADVLGVSKNTVSRDLEEVSHLGNSPTSTNAHPERGGRPRGLASKPAVEVERHEPPVGLADSLCVGSQAGDARSRLRPS
jgi:hypothetical protein